MKKRTTRITLSLSVYFILSFALLTACTKSNPAPDFAVNVPPSDAVYNSEVFPTQPSFVFYQSGTATPLVSIEDNVTLAAFLDNACIIPADGTLTADVNPNHPTNGIVGFSGVTYVLPTVFEQKIYLKASDTTFHRSTCSPAIQVAQRFRQGIGAVLTGVTSAAGATGNSEADIAKAVQIDSLNRVVMAGTSVNVNNGIEIAIWRYNPNGTPDATFGAGTGIAVSGATGAAGAVGAAESDIAKAVVLDSSGRIVIAGSSANAAGGVQAAVWRFNADGTIDTTFGGGAGYVVTSGTGAAGGTGASQLDTATAVQIDSSQNIIIAGSSVNAVLGVQAALWRFLATGAPDTLFGAGAGFVTTASTGAAGNAGNAEVDLANTFQIDANGNYLIAGSSADATGNELAIWKFLANGMPDTSFGAGSGYVVSGTTGASGATGNDLNDVANTLQLDSLGRMYLGGYSGKTGRGNEGAVWRYLPGGTPDLTFGQGAGFITTGDPGVTNQTGNAEDDRINALRLDFLGHLILAGKSVAAGGEVQTVVWKYNSDGTIIPSFGVLGTGYVISGPISLSGASGANHDDEINDLAIDQLGRYVTVGKAELTGGAFEAVVSRYLTTGVLDR